MTKNLKTTLLAMMLPALCFAQDCDFTKPGALQAFLKPGQRNAPLIMAHQGGTEDGFPGNSMATFERTYAKVPCVLLEFDVRMTADSLLIISHDDELSGKTNGKGLLSKTKWKTASRLKLKDAFGAITEFPIPTLQHVLAWSRDKNLVLIVDKKPETDIRRTIEMLRATENLAKSVLICYSLDEAKTAHRLAPDLMLAVGFNSRDHIDAVAKSGLPAERLVALTPRDLQDSPFYDKIHEMNIVASLGTNGNIDTLRTDVSKPMYQKLWESRGPDIICTDNPVFVNSLFVKKE
ncbi:glycerophosphodiester phosphodiesterase family protein [Dyadobacter sandarakinus]|uniref:Glycerophosphodiester phosphodiesterase family protein n=1 Tax=Dyadobacter sandarakinus TaxID=2747268 RepID=A0ABX7I6X9_9BACT|nr:glycerophosphodiester phosphodiesterase family protein [Dyadobacter sandarakinus]QRR01700.1 glycerophosphodiester phosphodiesterase family protein [Dyadobacter sandarakinus]